MSDVLIVGAGQLGLMMAAAGARFGISVDRIDHANGEVLPGTSRTRIALSVAEIVQRYPVITAELEHLRGNRIVEELARHPAWLNAEAMRLLPARDQQKGLLDQLDVPTSPWQTIATSSDIAAAQLRLGEALVLKSIRDGYDGKGQWLLKQADDDVASLIPSNMFGNIIAEKKITFRREVSIIGARFGNAQCHFLPLAENYHQAGMLRYTLAPAANSVALQASAERMLKTVMASLDYVGVMACECFDTAYGLVVNELAPRVHNSGHWTQAGANYSQFDLHLFAILNKAVPAPQHYAASAMMLNLIGCRWNPVWQTMADIQCYWYGKSWRQNRKLGHINIAAESTARLLDICDALMPQLDALHQRMLALAVQRLQQQGA